MKGWPRLEESAWMTFAASPLPVPVSPFIWMVISVGETFIFFFILTCFQEEGDSEEPPSEG